MAEAVYIHPSAVVDAGAILGNRTKIWHFCHVMGGASIGEDCSLGQNVFVASTARIGNNVKIQNNVSIYGGVILDDDVFCGPSMVFTNVLTPRSHVSRKDDYTETHVGRGASIGANATIVCGNRIGDFALIGAGAVVTRDVPAFAVMTGNPARQKGWACQCGELLHLNDDMSAVCTRCGDRYEEREHLLVRL